MTKYEIRAMRDTGEDLVVLDGRLPGCYMTYSAVGWKIMPISEIKALSSLADKISTSPFINELEGRGILLERSFDGFVEESGV